MCLVAALALRRARATFTPNATAPTGLAPPGEGERARRIGWLLLTTSGVFLISLVLRSIDIAVCGTIAVGTHFLWHPSTPGCSIAWCAGQPIGGGADRLTASGTCSGGAFADRQQSAKHGFSDAGQSIRASPADRPEGRRPCGSCCLSFRIGLAHPFKAAAHGLSPIEWRFAEISSDRRLRASPTRNGEDALDFAQKPAAVACARRLSIGAGPLAPSFESIGA